MEEKDNISSNQHTPLELEIMSIFTSPEWLIKPTIEPTVNVVTKYDDNNNLDSEKYELEKNDVTKLNLESLNNDDLIKRSTSDMFESMYIIGNIKIFGYNIQKTTGTTKY